MEYIGLLFPTFDVSEEMLLLCEPCRYIFWRDAQRKGIVQQMDGEILKMREIIPRSFRGLRLQDRKAIFSQIQSVS